MGSAYAATKEHDVVTVSWRPLMWCAHIILFADKASFTLNIKSHKDSEENSGNLKA